MSHQQRMRRTDELSQTPHPTLEPIFLHTRFGREFGGMPDFILWWAARPKLEPEFC